MGYEFKKENPITTDTTITTANHETTNPDYSYENEPHNYGEYGDGYYYGGNGDRDDSQDDKGTEIEDYGGYYEYGTDGSFFYTDEYGYCEGNIYDNFEEVVIEKC